MKVFVARQRYLPAQEDHNISRYRVAGLIHSLLLGILLILYSQSSNAGKWELKLELENSYSEDFDRRSSIEPTLIYSSGGLRTHLEFEKQIHPESRDGKLEWQIDYKWKFNRSSLTLRNELTRNFDRNRTESELTPKWYYRPGKNFQIGFDLEIDYFDSLAESEFRLFEVEIEPAVIWQKKWEESKFSAKLEYPKYRLYSNNELIDNVKYTGYEVILKYQKFFRPKLGYEFELKLPYNAITEELRYRPNFSLRYKF